MSQTIEICEELESIIKFNYGYLHMAPSRLWGECGSRGRGLHFGEGGIGRLMNIFGWIGGIYQAAGDLPNMKEFAERCARDLFKTLDYLANYGGYAGKDDEEREKKKNPAYIVELYDDSTLHGFSLSWYRALNWHDFVKETRWHEKDKSVQEQIVKDRKIICHTPYGSREVLRRPAGVIFPSSQYAYTYCMNGAMLYRGPGKGETFSVDLGSAKDCLWGIHT